MLKDLPELANQDEERQLSDKHHSDKRVSEEHLTMRQLPDNGQGLGEEPLPSAQEDFVPEVLPPDEQILPVEEAHAPENDD